MHQELKILFQRSIKDYYDIDCIDAGVKSISESGKDDLEPHFIYSGEVPCAFIEMVKDKPISEKELIDFCKETLAGFKVPKKVVFCELPKTSTGKIQKFELRKKF